MEKKRELKDKRECALSYKQKGFCHVPNVSEDERTYCEKETLFLADDGRNTSNVCSFRVPSRKVVCWGRGVWSFKLLVNEMAMGV